eukprot:1159857-Pelagomonas_calceolata.AAC.9
MAVTWSEHGWMSDSVTTLDGCAQILAPRNVPRVFKAICLDGWPPCLSPLGQGQASLQTGLMGSMGSKLLSK